MKWLRREGRCANQGAERILSQIAFPSGRGRNQWRVDGRCNRGLWWDARLSSATNRGIVSDNLAKMEHRPNSKTLFRNTQNRTRPALPDREFLACTAPRDRRLCVVEETPGLVENLYLSKAGIHKQLGSGDVTTVGRRQE